MFYNIVFFFCFFVLFSKTFVTNFINKDGDLVEPPIEHISRSSGSSNEKNAKQKFPQIIETR
jgi:hypothetical protein